MASFILCICLLFNLYLLFPQCIAKARTDHSVVEDNQIQDEDTASSQSVCGLDNTFSCTQETQFKNVVTTGDISATGKLHTGAGISTDGGITANGNIAFAGKLQVKAGISTDENLYVQSGVLIARAVDAQSIHSNRRISTGEYLEINGAALEGSICSGSLLTFSPKKVLLSCVEGFWRNVSLSKSPNTQPRLHTEIVQGNNTCNNSALSLAQCPEGYLVSGGGYRLVSWKKGGNLVPESNYAYNLTTWVIQLPRSVQIHYCSRAVANCIKVIA